MKPIMREETVTILYDKFLGMSPGVQYEGKYDDAKAYAECVMVMLHEHARFVTAAPKDALYNIEFTVDGVYITVYWLEAKGE